MAEMPAGARHGRLPAVNLPPRSPVVNPERIGPVPAPRDHERHSVSNRVAGRALVD